MCLCLRTYMCVRAYMCMLVYASSCKQTQTQTQKQAQAHVFEMCCPERASSWTSVRSKQSLIRKLTLIFLEIPFSVSSTHRRIISPQGTHALNCEFLRDEETSGRPAARLSALGTVCVYDFGTLGHEEDESSASALAEIAEIRNTPLVIIPDTSYKKKRQTVLHFNNIRKQRAQSANKTTSVSSAHKHHSPKMSQTNKRSVNHNPIPKRATSAKPTPLFHHTRICLHALRTDCTRSTLP